MLLLKSVLKEQEKKVEQCWVDYEKYPSFLGIELIYNLRVRENQYKVGNFLFEQTTPTVTQLHMGEGKTSVILPLLCLMISTKQKPMIPRVIIPESILWAVNDLYLNLGFLGYRFFIFLCSRTEKIKSLEYFTSLESMSTHGTGAILTTVSSILSFRNLNYLNSTKDDSKFKFRNIIDEADDLLNVDKQLIYSLGNCVLFDKCHLRFTTLEMIVDYIIEYNERRKKEILENENAILKKNDYSLSYMFDSGERWRLESEIIDHLYINHPSIEDIFDDEEAILFQKSLIHSKNDISKEGHILTIYLRGLFHNNIIFNALINREYNINYGLDSNSKRNVLYSIPYIANQTPSSRTDFSHPDTWILYTILSYYSRGLSNNQLNHVCEMIDLETHPDKIYLKWVQDCSSSIEMPTSWLAVNLKDSQILLKIQQMRWSRVIIKYYLNKFLFPKFAKEFTQKLISSPWNLIDSSTIGFSGTKGVSYLFPNQAQQKNLSFSIETDCKMDELLLKNNDIIVIKKKEELNEEEEEDLVLNCFLKRTKEVSVILDVGGLVKDRNKIFAKKWLLNSPEKYRSVVFFDHSTNHLQLMNRKKKCIPFDHRTPLEDSTLLYLDQYHSRGSDFKLNDGTIAFLTIGINTNRDDLAQGAMRLRKLNTTQSLIYIIPPQVYIRLIPFLSSFENQSNNNNNVTTKSILNFTYKNLHNLIQESIPLFCLQAKYYYDNQIQCEDNNILKYALESKYLSIHETINHFGSKKYSNNILICLEKNETIQYLKNEMIKIGEGENTMNEEQEREIESEMLIQEERQKPPKANPILPKFSNNLENFINGLPFKDSPNSTLPQLTSWFINNNILFFSDEFFHLVDSRDAKFLRRTKWIVEKNNCDQFFVITDFEASYIKKLIFKKKIENISLIPFFGRNHSNNQLMIEKKLILSSKQILHLNEIDRSKLFLKEGNDNDNDVFPHKNEEFLFQLNLRGLNLYLSLKELIYFQKRIGIVLSQNHCPKKKGTLIHIPFKQYQQLLKNKSISKFGLILSRDHYYRFFGNSKETEIIQLPNNNNHNHNHNVHQYSQKISNKMIEFYENRINQLFMSEEYYQSNLFSLLKFKNLII